jgi:hypothetical protein
MKTINAIGMEQIRAWLADNWVYLVTVTAVNGWAIEAETSPDGLIEIRARESKSGHPVTLIVSPDGFSHERP